MVGPCAKNMVTMEMHEAQSAKRSAWPAGRPSIDREFEYVYEYSLGAGRPSA